MSIYDPLGAYLRSRTEALVPMTFREIEQLLQVSLPSAKFDRAWWSKQSDGNPMSEQWLQSGYTADTVDVTAERLVFRKVDEQADREANDADGGVGRTPDGMMRYSELDDRLLFLKDYVILEEGYDYTQPLWPTEDDV
jgi:hypothetical protein